MDGDEILKESAAAAAGDSVAFLRAHTQECQFSRADIASLAKRLVAGDIPPPADGGDPAALKVEKNALAIIFIPAVFSRAEEILAAHPDVLFYPDGDRLGTVERAAVRQAIDRRNPQGSLCQLLYRSLSNLFQHVAEQHFATLDDQAAAMLSGRYGAALAAYHAHTKVPNAVFFTPANHVMAGVHTALFFILRVLSAITVLGQKRLGRPLSAAEIGLAAHNSAPLLLTIARCHLEQLLELEALMGKGSDLYLTALDAPAYAAALEGMFALAPGAELRLEFSAAVQSNLPRHLTSDKPRTGCPALFAATHDATNAIVALVRIVETAFVGLID